MVDEYQDTNHVQYRWLQLLTSEHRNLAVVGDDAQCLVAGTPITMGDGSTKPIEAVAGGRRGPVLLRERRLPARPASRTRSRSTRSMGVEITTRGGPRIVSTPEHTHFAGLPRRAHAAAAPDLPRCGGATRASASERRAPPDTASTRRRTASQIRAAQEHADAAWVLSTHDTEAPGPRGRGSCSRFDTGSRRCRSFARPGGSVNGLVHDQALIDERVRGVDSYAHGRATAAPTSTSTSSAPHHVPLSFEGRRRNVTLTLCGDRRGAPADARRRHRRPRRGGARARSTDAGLQRAPGEAWVRQLALRVRASGLRTRGRRRRRASRDGDFPSPPIAARRASRRGKSACRSCRRRRSGRAW